MKKIDAVIPIRFADACFEDGSPRYLLQGRPLWDWTIEQALEKNGLNKSIVAYDDTRFEKHLDRWNNELIKFVRPKHLSRHGISLFEVVEYVIGHIYSKNETPDYVMMLEITHPLRPKGIIQQLVEITQQNFSDSVFTVYPVHYNFWRQESDDSMKRFQGSGDNRQINMLRELTGICSIFRFDLLKSENPFGEEIDMVPIDRFWATIDVRDDDGLWLAEQYLNRISWTS